MNRHLLTTKQAADILGVSQSFLERDRWAGAQIPFVRVGKRSVRYRNKDIDAFIESRVFSSTSSYSEQEKSVQA
ncbi:helix-turn-helix transcriptional regulator [Sessilibacter corallicola]|uniref:Helix-turn-helix domain-containing protein n=1 Tax=Sessilibacter corallicola TaxID=2904075 RepID=A0ABQ0ADN4_9GAMM